MENYLGCSGHWMSSSSDNAMPSGYNPAISWSHLNSENLWSATMQSWTPMSGVGSWAPVGAVGNSSTCPVVMQPCNSNVVMPGHVMVGWAVPVNISLGCVTGAQYLQPALVVQPNSIELGEQPEVIADQVPVVSSETMQRRRRDGRAQVARTQVVASFRKLRSLSGSGSPMARASERAELAHKKTALRKDRIEDVCATSRRFEVGSDAWKNLIEAVQGRVLILAFDASGCRLVQDALVSSPEDTAAALADELRGHILRAIDSPHANFVVQKVVDVLPFARVSFVIDEIAGAVVETARHRNGCRVLSRVFERYSVEDGVKTVDEGNADAAVGGRRECSTLTAVVDGVLREAAALSRHPLGHFVIEAVLQHGTVDQRAKVAGSLHGRLIKSAKNRSASYIVERALQLCGLAERDAMITELLMNKSDFLLLAQCRFGRYVVKTVASFDDDHGRQARGLLQGASKDLRMNKYGARLFDEFEQTFLARSDD